MSSVFDVFLRVCGTYSTVRVRIRGGYGRRMTRLIQTAHQGIKGGLGDKRLMREQKTDEEMKGG